MKLNELGFIVTEPSPNWRIAVGALLTRTEVAREYGGAIYSGIQPSSTSSNVMLYSDPAEGEQHGYVDGWSQRETGVFEYTGAGQFGDQELAGANAAILNHRRDGRVLRLFFTQAGSAGPGGKVQQYVGAFRLDPDAPLRWMSAADSSGSPRKVVVFRLLPDEVVAGYPRTPVAQPSVGVRRQPTPERALNICPTCQLELPRTGVCDNCS